MTRQTVDRVWMLTTYPLWNGEAYAARVTGEANALIRRGLDVGYLRVVPLSAWADRAREESKIQVESAGAQVIDVLQPPDRGISVLRRLQTGYLRLKIARLVRRHGVRRVHAQGIRAGSLASQIEKRVPVVLDVHGDVVAEITLASKRDPSMKGRIRWADRDTSAALARAETLVSVSPGMTTWLRSLTAERRVPIYEVPCGVELGRFTDVAMNHNRGLTVLYLGGLQAYQPPELIAKSCAQLAKTLPSAVFRVITPGSLSDVRAAFAQVGLDVEVGCVPFTEVGKEMARADLGIVPRIHDQTNRVACPTKIAEYLAAGVPVACSPHVGGWAEYLSDRGVGISLDASDSELLTFTREITENRTSIGERCRNVARNDWSWDQLASLLEAAHGVRSDD